MAPLSKVPIYPRPVSPLSAESLDVEPQDVIYASSYPSSDDDSNARAAKRRRIEKLGEQYLRGDGLHILSAGLKGPFCNGWKNPWANRGRDNQQAVAEIPETAGKSVTKLPAQKAGPAKAKDSKVEDWLRRNNAYSSFQDDDQSSPTPPCAKSVDIRDATLAKPIPKPTRDLTYEPACRPDSMFEKHKVVEHSVLHQHDVQSVPGPADTANRALQYEITDNAPIGRRAWVSHAANEDRAEFAALKSKRRVLEVAPASTMLSPFEYRRVSNGAHKSGKFEAVADPLQGENHSMAPPAANQVRAWPTKDDTEGLDEAKRLHAASDAANVPQAVMTSTSSAVPALSTDTSRASMANLPSAQPQSLNVPAPSTNNLAFEEQALDQHMEPVHAIEEPPRSSHVYETEAALASKQVNTDESRSISKERQTPHLLKKARSGVDQTRSPVTVAKEDRNLNTQEMLAGMSPIAFSTVKKAISELQWCATPVTVTNCRPEKSARSVSFARGEKVPSDSSQGSLKASLRVSKGVSLVGIGKENKLISVGEEEINDEQYSDLFTNSVKESVPPAASPKGLKSALKPSGPPIPTAPFPSTKGSTSTGIDGGQNAPLIEDDAFDLEGAIDNLGSYLGTWDPEKEASSLGIKA